MSHSWTEVLRLRKRKSGHIYYEVVREDQDGHFI